MRDAMFACAVQHCAMLAWPRDAAAMGSGLMDDRIASGACCHAAAIVTSACNSTTLPVDVLRPCPLRDQHFQLTS